MTDEFLFIIPARGGSKGLPGKNTKMLNGKPLIQYSIELARQIISDKHICISTDDTTVFAIAKKLQIEVPFKRPAELASDTSNTYDVIDHALDYYSSLGANYKTVVLLQPTSPFRKKSDVLNAINLYSNEIDMVMSVKETEVNPYYLLFEENDSGFLEKVKKPKFSRRQDCPTVYEANGAVYVINVKHLKRIREGNSTKIIKSLMPTINSMDIDTQLDWDICETLINKGYIKD